VLLISKKTTGELRHLLEAGLPWQNSGSLWNCTESPDLYANTPMAPVNLPRYSAMNILAV